MSIVAIFLSILIFIMTTSVFDKLVEESINEIPKEQVEQMLNLGTNTENQVVIPEIWECILMQRIF